MKTESSYQLPLGGACYTFCLAFVLGVLPIAAASAQATGAAFEPQFLRLCDLACERINSSARQKPKAVPFYTGRSPWSDQRNYLMGKRLGASGGVNLRL